MHFVTPLAEVLSSQLFGVWAKDLGLLEGGRDPTHQDLDGGADSTNQDMGFGLDLLDPAPLNFTGHLTLLFKCLGFGKTEKILTKPPFPSFLNPCGF
jgi:hypothetical protein